MLEDTLKLIAENEKREQEIIDTLLKINANMEASINNLAAIDFMLNGGIR